MEESKVTRGRLDDPNPLLHSEAGSKQMQIRPFRVMNVAEAELAELRRGIHATKPPDRETARDQPQGPRLATMQKLGRY
jgi:hypothetical protein